MGAPAICVAVLVTAGIVSAQEKPRQKIPPSDIATNWPAAQPREPLGKMITRPMITGGNSFMLGLRADGTCLAIGNTDVEKWKPNPCHLCFVDGWRDIIIAEAGYNHSVGLKSDGTVVAVGQTNAIGVSDWKDIVAIAAGYSHTVGLKADGTVVVAGNFGNDPGVAGWKDIVAVGAGMGWTVGVKKDGTCVAAGSNGSGGCDVSDWRDIVSVVCTYGTTTGLKSDGTVVMTTFKPTTPANKENNEKHPLDTSKWRRIIDIRCSNWQVIGLRDDGRVEFCGKRPDACNPCREWQDIQAVGATEESVMGVKSDGSVVALGTEFDKRPLKAVNGWNLGPVDPKFPRVPHGRDRRLPWPEE